MTFFNRAIIAGSNGLINLTVPLAGGRDQKGSVKDRQINKKENWQRTHWRSITACYNKSPYFEYYRSDIEAIIFKKWDFLVDLNMTILYWSINILRLPIDIIFTETKENSNFKPSDKSDDLRNCWLPKNFQTGDLEIRYLQVFEDRIGFQKNLSIIDLIFNAGPEAPLLLKGEY